MSLFILGIISKCQILFVSTRFLDYQNCCFSQEQKRINWQFDTLWYRMAALYSAFWFFGRLNASIYGKKLGDLLSTPNQQSRSSPESIPSSGFGSPCDPVRAKTSPRAIGPFVLRMAEPAFRPFVGCRFCPMASWTSRIVLILVHLVTRFARATEHMMQISAVYLLRYFSWITTLLKPSIRE
jgi:hypothetical protein